MGASESFSLFHRIQIFLEENNIMIPRLREAARLFVDDPDAVISRDGRSESLNVADHKYVLPVVRFFLFFKKMKKKNLKQTTRKPWTTL
jgi:hypothetical protein